MEPAIRAEGLQKRFGSTRAVDQVDLNVPAGTVLGILGPNGAGKTTTVRMLATLIPPDGGHAEVAGLDVVRQARRVRAVIGLTGQYAAVDQRLTGRENLRLIGRLHRLGRRRSRARADEMIERLGLPEAADRPSGTYSGGMRRRLDLAASLLAEPQVLFLDEPTTGLDPVSRTALWQLVRDEVDRGLTVLLTTQYLEEADQLADRIMLIDGGRVVVEGTAKELKRAVGGEHLEVRLTRPEQAQAAVSALGRATSTVPTLSPDGMGVSLALPTGLGTLPAALAALGAADFELVDLAVRRPTLDDVFVALTTERPQNGPQTGRSVA